MLEVSEGTIAISKDIEQMFGLKLGDEVILELGNKYYNFVFEDRMATRKTKQVDIFMWSKKQAIKFGVKSGKLHIKT